MVHLFGYLSFLVLTALPPLDKAPWLFLRLVLLIILVLSCYSGFEPCF